MRGCAGSKKVKRRKFLPIGSYSIYAITRETNASLVYQLIGLGIAILGHAAIILFIRRNIARLKASSVAMKL